MLAFISTNIDDIFILMLFFSVSASEYDRMKVVLGQYSGLGLLFVFSLLISAGLAVVFLLCLDSRLCSACSRSKGMAVQE